MNKLTNEQPSSHFFLTDPLLIQIVKKKRERKINDNLIKINFPTSWQKNEFPLQGKEGREIETRLFPTSTQ